MSGVTDRHEMAHVIVRRSGSRYVGKVVGDDVRAEADSPAGALRELRDRLAEQVNNRSTREPESR
jgi:hypothetical protein